MTGSMEGKVAIITGAGSGIGRASAIKFAGEGASVVVADISHDSADQTAAMVRKNGGRAMVIVCDVTDPASVKSMVGQTVEAYGRLDYAHNNVGVRQRPLAPVAELSEEEWNRILNINLTGVFHCMKYEIIQMLSQGHGGSIVNTASTAGTRGNRMAPSYVAAKHGVVGLTKSGALAYARQGIRINVICPSVVDTPFSDLKETMRPELIAMTPIGRIAQPEEIAEAALWLCSDRASYTTGAVFNIDGGYTA